MLSRVLSGRQAFTRAGIGNESDQVPEGRSVDAWARAGDEGRGTLRKAVGSCEQALIRGYPNGETHFQRSVIRRQEPDGASFLASIFWHLISEKKYLPLNT